VPCNLLGAAEGRIPQLREELWERGISWLLATRCLPALHHSFSDQNVFAVITSSIRRVTAHCPPMMDQILLITILPLS
jgi:hypothetical protein